MAMAPRDLSPEALDFLTVRHLATLTTLRPDGSPHVTPVGFTWDAETSTARVITSRGSRKTRNAAAGGPAVLCQVDGRWWLSLEGTTQVLDDPDVRRPTPSGGMPPATGSRAPTPSASSSPSASRRILGNL